MLSRLLAGSRVPAEGAACPPQKKNAPAQAARSRTVEQMKINI